MSRKSCIIITIIALVIILLLCSCGGIIWLITSAATESSLTAYEPTERVIEEGGEDKIAVIKVHGMILDTDVDTGFLTSDIAAAQKIIEQIEKAERDDKVKAIILDLNTPGGEVYASDIIHNKLAEAQDNGIKIVGYMRGTAASGGYYVSAPSDKIIANELTMTGSIGVIAQFQNLNGLYEKLGIDTRTMTHTGGEFKAGEGLFDEDPAGEEDQVYQVLIDEAYERFVTIVADGRGMTKEEVKKLADGRVYSGKQALDNGLVDELGNFDRAVFVAETLAGVSDATLIEYRDDDFWSALMEASSVAFDPTAKLAEAIDTTPGMKLMYVME